MAYNTWERSQSVSEPALKIGKRFKLLLHEYCQSLYQDLNTGGIRMVNVEVMIKALRLAWIPRLLSNCFFCP